MFVVRVLANWAASYKLLGYVLDIPSISEQELKVLINGCKLLKVSWRILILYSNEPITVVRLQKLANQPIFNGTLVISVIIFMKTRKTLALW